MDETLRLNNQEKTLQKCLIFTSKYHIMVLRGENMVFSYNVAKNNFKEYSNINNKISREIRDGNLYKIVNGLYETDPNTPGYLLASSIYGPSYISFEYALSYYGLIPERVTTITCATFDKKKKKEYNTDFGVFTYRDVPSSVYPEEIILKEENNYIKFQISNHVKGVNNSAYYNPYKNLYKSNYIPELRKKNKILPHLSKKS